MILNCNQSKRVITINEGQYKELISEGIGFGFSLGTLKSLDKYAKRVRYCKEFLGPNVGNGSSRMCFQLDDEKILKLAKNEKGMAQNEEEGHPDYIKDSYTCFPKVFKELSDMTNYSFLVSEYVLPAKSSDVKACLGITAKEFFSFLETCSYNSGQCRHRFLPHGMMDDNAFETLIENNDTLADLYDYICNYDAPVGDMLRFANWGMVNRNGHPELVLLDSGLSHEIFNDYYRR